LQTASRNQSAGFGLSTFDRQPRRRSHERRQALSSGCGEAPESSCQRIRRETRPENSQGEDSQHGGLSLPILGFVAECEFELRHFFDWGPTTHWCQWLTTRTGRSFLFGDANKSKGWRLWQHHKPLVYEIDYTSLLLASHVFLTSLIAYQSLYFVPSRASSCDLL
jgi:hypothetical protein